MSCPDFVFDIFSVQQYKDENAEAFEDEAFFIKEALAVAIQERLTDSQRKYFLAYYSDRMPIWGVALKYGVNESTVSRQLKAARKRLWEVMRYTHPRLLHAKMPESNKLKKEKDRKFNCKEEML